MSEPVFSSTTQLAAAIRAGDISAVEVLEAHLAQQLQSHGAAVETAPPGYWREENIRANQWRRPT